jgi:molybdopterin synthase sulfur carrier subunit
MSTVRIPPALRTATGGEKRVEVAGETVGEVLDALVSAYPALREPVLAADGSLNRFVNVYLDDTDVRHLDGRQTPLGESTVLTILPAMAGGSGAESSGEPTRPRQGCCACPRRTAGRD